MRGLAIGLVLVGVVVIALLATLNFLLHRQFIANQRQMVSYVLSHALSDSDGIACLKQGRWRMVQTSPNGWHSQRDSDLSRPADCSAAIVTHGPDPEGIEYVPRECLSALVVSGHLAVLGGPDSEPQVELRDGKITPEAAQSYRQRFPSYHGFFRADAVRFAMGQPERCDGFWLFPLTIDVTDSVRLQEFAPVGLK